MALLGACAQVNIWIFECFEYVHVWTHGVTFFKTWQFQEPVLKWICVCVNEYRRWMYQYLNVWICACMNTWIYKYTVNASIDNKYKLKFYFYECVDVWIYNVYTSRQYTNKRWRKNNTVNKWLRNEDVWKYYIYMNVSICNIHTNRHCTNRQWMTRWINDSIMKMYENITSMNVWICNVLTNRHCTNRHWTSLSVREVSIRMYITYPHIHDDDTINKWLNNEDVWKYHTYDCMDVCCCV